MVIANLSNLCWTSGQPRRNQAVFSQLLLDAKGAFEEGFYIQPPMVKTARTFQFSRGPELEVVSKPGGFTHPVTVLQPVLTLPVGYPPLAIRRSVIELAGILVKRHFRKRPYLLWINSITHFQGQLAEELMPGAESRIFDSTDLLMMYARNGGEHSVVASGILNASDVAICASQQAMAQISHPVKHLLTCCAESRVFQSNGAPLDLPPLFPKPQGAVYIGFLGMLTSERTDFDLLHAIFLRFPEFRFVFVGSTNRSSLLSRLKSYPNFHHVPMVHDELVSSVIQQFDVAIVPDLDNDYMRGSDGTRIFDYLACGVPVLSTAAKDKQKFEDSIQIAGSIWEFSYQLERLVTSPRPKPASAPVLEHWNFGTATLRDLLKMTDPG